MSNDSTSGRERQVSTHPAVATYARHVNPAFIRLLGLFGYGRVFVHASGMTLRDHEGREYLDFLAGFGAANLGHSHPRFTEAMRAFLLESVPNLIHVGPSIHTARLAEKLAKLAGAPLEVSLFSSSGGEAVEAGLKLARAATGRAPFVYCKGGYHGTNLGSLSIMGTSRMRAPFEPLLSDCEAIAFGDLRALDKALSRRKVAAFVVEPIQGEAGVVMPPRGYLAEAQQICRKRGTLLVLDEVQTGIGRTGTMFAFQQEGFVPDVLVLGKALGGSITPISATMASRELVDRAYGSVERFDLHSSTFAGNGFGCAAALETLAIVEEDQLAERARTMGDELVTALKKRLAGHPFVREIRGRGLLIGVELGPTQSGIVSRLAPGLVRLVAKRVLGQWLSVRLLERGILAQPAAQEWDVLKLEPPLIVQRAELTRVVDEVGAILDEYRELPALLSDVTARLGAQLIDGWRFR